MLDAVVDLFEAGDPEPAVEEVSARSGVSTRSIYRYFHHRDGLFSAALGHLVARVAAEHPLEIDDGPLPSRIQQFVSHRLDVHARVAPLTRVANRFVGCPDDSGDTITEAPTERAVFVDSVAATFAADLASVPADRRRMTEVAAEMAVQFESIEFLVRAFEGNRAAVEAVLVCHLSRQFSPEAGLIVPNAALIL